MYIRAKVRAAQPGWEWNLAGSDRRCLRPHLERGHVHPSEGVGVPESRWGWILAGRGTKSACGQTPERGAGHPSEGVSVGQLAGSGTSPAVTEHCPGPRLGGTCCSRERRCRRMTTPPGGGAPARRCSEYSSTVPERRVTLRVSGTDIFGARPNQSVVRVLLESVGGSTRKPRLLENRREQSRSGCRERSRSKPSRSRRWDSASSRALTSASICCDISNHASVTGALPESRDIWRRWVARGSSV